MQSESLTDLNGVWASFYECPGMLRKEAMVSAIVGLGFCYNQATEQSLLFLIVFGQNETDVNG